MLLFVSAVSAANPILPRLAALTFLFGMLKLATELPIFRSLQIEDYSPLHKTALLLTGQLGLLHRCRIALGVVGGVILPILFALQLTRPVAIPPALILFEATAITLLCLAGELIERRLFFVAVQPLQMPGGVTA